MNLIFIGFLLFNHIQWIPGYCCYKTCFLIFLLWFCFVVNGIQYYQCSSEEDEFCPAFEKFDETKNALVDCFSLESYGPGHMCMEMVKESYDTFYGP